MTNEQVDTHDPAGMAAFLRERAKANREIAELPREEWPYRPAVLQHFAFRFEQAAQMIERLSRPAHEREPPHCSTCACGALEPSDDWRDIATVPNGSDERMFWVVPKSAAESYTDTSGTPIVGKGPGRLHVGRYLTWSALEKATHWQPKPAEPLQLNRKPPHD